MLYTGICLDNREYFKKGTIRVRIWRFYTKSNGAEDLSSNKDLIDEGVNKSTGVHSDFDAVVFSPIGGGRNYGLLMLPQINEKGIVAFLDEEKNLHKPIWLGSYFSPHFTNERKIDYINIPGDTVDAEGANQDGSKDGVKQNFGGDERTIVLRTKFTEPTSNETLNWEEQRTENLFVLDNNKVRLRHFTQWNGENNEKYQEILIDKENNKETITFDVNNTLDDKRGLFKLTEDGVNIKITDSTGNGDSLTIWSETDGLHIQAKSGKIFLNGESGTVVSLVTYDQLKTIIEKLEAHIHYGETNSLVTSKPVDSNFAPLNLTEPINKMEADDIKTEQK